MKPLISLFAGFFLAIPFGIFAAESPFEIAKKQLLLQGILTPQQAQFYKPTDTVRRDDFTSIVLGVNCKNCRNPNPADILTYGQSPFPDVSPKNSNYFCITEGAESKIINGYTTSQSEFACKDGTKVIGGTAYCPGNAITRIEAIAILLRQAGLWDDSRTWTRSSLQIQDTNSYWQWYAETVVRLGYMSAPGGKIRPDDAITFEDFVLLSWKLLQVNSCELQGMVTPSSTSNGFIRLYEPGTNCTKPLDPNSPRWATVDAGIVLVPDTTLKDITWKYRAFPEDARVTQKTGWSCLLSISTAGNGTTTIHATFTTQTSPTPSDASSSFIRNSPSSRDPQAIMWFDISPLTGNGPLTTQFSLKTQFSDPSATASYIFGHTEGAGTGRTTDHTYVNAGLYQTLSTAVSGDRIIRTTAPILVLENADFDGDGIEDRVDLCPRVFGLKVYQGCPFIHEFLIDLDARIDGNPTENSSGALFGGDSWNLVTTLQTSFDACLLSQQVRKSILLGASYCISCPCNEVIRSPKSLQSCDILLPAVAQEPLQILKLWNPYLFVIDK